MTYATRCLSLWTKSLRQRTQTIDAVVRRASVLSRRVAMHSTSTRYSYLNQSEAQQIDVDLMSPRLGFSIYQLMELAGLSCASAIREEYPPTTHPAVLVLCGPGNNGGDGLVCARHLHQFGYPNVQVSYPKFKAENELYNGLVTQLKSLGLSFVDTDEATRLIKARETNVVVDAMFGFSFTGVPREPFATLISATAGALQDGDRPGNNFAVACIDVPSGFHVEDGDVHGLYPVHPHMLISLTAPKLCAKTFRGNVHYLGGRFVPPAIAEKYNLVLPLYPGTSQCVKITNGDDVSNIAPEPLESMKSIRKTYDATISTSLFSVDNIDGVAENDPIILFNQWFADAQTCAEIDEPNAMAVTSVNADHQPSTRFVLLRGVDERGGFKFFTNYNSRKGTDFEHNQATCATFFWEPFSRSVRVEGRIEKLSADESDAYWDSRPREHQLGALASNQSSPISDDAELLDRYATLEAKYTEEASIPRPDWWGGYVIVPHRIEFWQGRASRLHERLEFIRRSSRDSRDAWHTQRLSP